MASGDAHSAAQLTGSLSSLLDEQAVKAEEASNEPVEEEVDTEGMTQEEIEELEKKKRGKEEEKRQKMKKEKEARIKVRYLFKVKIILVGHGFDFELQFKYSA